jgi:hypothetical protein
LPSQLAAVRTVWRPSRRLFNCRDTRATTESQMNS